MEEHSSQAGNPRTTAKGKVRLQLVPNTGQKSRGLPILVEGPTYAAIAHAARNKLQLPRGGGLTKNNKKKQGGRAPGASRGANKNIRLFLQDGRELQPPVSSPDEDAVLPLKQDTIIVVSSGEAFVSSAGRLLEEEQEKPDLRHQLSRSGSPADETPRHDHREVNSLEPAATALSETGVSSGNAGQLVASILERLPPLPLGHDDLALSMNDDDADDHHQDTEEEEEKQLVEEEDRPSLIGRGEQQTETDRDEELAEEAGHHPAAVPEAQHTAIALAKRGVAMVTFDFVGPFPVMEGNVLPLLREAIKDCDDFVVTDCGEYVAFDYRRVTKETFPDPAQIPAKKKHVRRKWMMAARRECRGLLVSQSTGCVLARRFHKFFNVNERPESAAENIPLCDSVLLTEKVDGCLVSPVLLLPASSKSSPSGQQRLLWVTKSQPMKKIAEFVVAAAANRIARFEDLSVELIAKSFTPLFEWCDPSIGLVEHRTQSLTLLAVRHNVTGQYLEREALEVVAAKFVVPVTPRIALDLERTPTAASLQAHVDSWEPGSEGLVITVPQTGLMYKLKSHWYRTLHANSGIANLAKVLAERPSLHGVPASMVWSAVVSGSVDDLLPLLRSARNDGDAELLSGFVTSYHASLTRLRAKLQAWGGQVKHAIHGHLPHDASAGASVAKMEDLVLQQLALKIGSLPHMPAALSAHWSKRTLQCFVRPEPTARQEQIIEEIAKSLAAKGKWRQLESLLKLSWQRTLAAGSPATLSEDDSDEAALFGDASEPERSQGQPGREGGEGPAKIQIFCDLDGVLADFTSGIHRISKGQVVADGSPQMWALIRKNKNFWTSLETMDGADQLWAYLQAQPHGSAFPKILTGIPDGKMGHVAREQKQIWCRKRLCEEVEVIACQSSRKHAYSRFGHVLIDDRESMREGWEQMGGHFVLHKDAFSTLALLRTLLPDLKDQLDSSRELLQQAAASRATNSPREVFSVAEEAIVIVEGAQGLSEFVEALSRAQVTGVDVEWPPDAPGAGLAGGLNRAALLQVAVSEDRVFLVDLLCLHVEAKQAIVKLFEDPVVLKLGFGFQEDLHRLGLDCGVQSALDLARAIPVFMPSYSRGEAPSLGRAVELLLGVRMQKSKILQAFNWALRPLPLTHQQYAASDAACLLRMHSTIARWTPLRALLRAFVTDLSPPSKRQRQLLSAGGLQGTTTTPSRSKQRVTLHSVLADHVTLAFAPSLDQVKELPVGDEATVRVLGHAVDASVQAAAVELVSPVHLPATNALLHVTLSTRPGIPPSRSNELLARGFVPLPTSFNEELRLSGVVGLVVANEFVMAELPPKILAEIQEFSANGLPGQCLEFGKKQALTSMERQALHKYAEEHGLESESTGRKHQRVITLRIPHRLRKEDTGQEPGTVHDLRIMKSGNEDENRRLMRHEAKFKQKASGAELQIIQVKDMSTLRSLQLVFQSLENASAFGSAARPVHGCIQEDGTVRPLPPSRLLSGDRELIFNLLASSRGDISTGDRIVLIMRGLPGSGKSSLVRTLAESAAPDYVAVCSADEFWERGAGRSNKELKHMRSEGMSEEDIYAHCWDESRLDEAHDYCFSRFREALDAARQLVVVDNVNSQRKDYANYVVAAANEGYSVLQLEIICATEGEMVTFQRRCRHRVPIKAMAGIWRRWESADDPPAILLSPFIFQEGRPTDDDDDVEDMAGEAGQSLMQWLSRRKAFGPRGGKHRKPTHMMAELEDRPSKFIFIPPESYLDFLRCYAADTSPKFLIEHCSAPVSPLFFDLDYVAKEEMTSERMLDIVRCLQGTVQGFYPEREPADILGGVIVTGGPPYQYGDKGFIKSGRHIIFPNVLVTLEQALCVATAAMARLAAKLGEDLDSHQRWDQMVDMAVYRGPTPGMRMLGSRKTVRNSSTGQWVDSGMGVHTLRAVVDATGEPDGERFLTTYAHDPVALLQAASIRSSASRPTPGFVGRESVGPLDQTRTEAGPKCAPQEDRPHDSVAITAVDLDDIEFKPAKEDLVDHVLTRYLPRKLANFLGIPLKDLTDDTHIMLSPKHGPSEGKIHGMWEQFSKGGIIDLRVDLQPQRKEGRTSHYGDEEFANWQVQFGASQVCKASSRARPGQTEAGAFAGVFMRTGEAFRVGDLKKAMALSFSTRKYACLDYVASSTKRWADLEASEQAAQEVRQVAAARLYDGEEVADTEADSNNRGDEGDSANEDEDGDEDEKDKNRRGHNKKVKHKRKNKRLLKHQRGGFAII